MFKLLAVIMLVTLLRSATACPASIVSGQGAVETNSALCVSQGEGSYTFAMKSSLTTLGLPSSTEGYTAFQIMDSGCNILGTYSPSNCDPPWTIEDSFLQYVLSITSVSEEANSDASFSFNYANGKYSIGNNHCTCNSIDVGFPSAAEGCKCAFPVAGQPSKRETPFEA